MYTSLADEFADSVIRQKNGETWPHIYTVYRDY